MAGLGTAEQAAAQIMDFEEQSRLRAAIKAPLMLQAPLQSVLESLLEKVAAQGAALYALQQQQPSQDGLFERLRFLESRFDELFGAPGEDAPLSPFKQQDMLERLDALEAAVATQRHEVRDIRRDTETTIRPAVRKWVDALRGVDNLAGRAIATDAMADELGITVPQIGVAAPTMPAISEGDEAPAVPSLLASAPPDADAPGAAPAAPPLSLGARDVSTSAAEPEPAARPPKSATAAIWKPSAQKGVIARITDSIADLNGQNDALQQSLRTLADQHRRDGGAHAAALADAQARIAELEAANSALTSQLSAQSLDGDALGKQEAKLGDLASLVHSQRRQLDETEVAVKHVKHQDLVELREQLHALAGRQPTELQQAVRLLERDTEVIKKKLSGGLLAALGADAAALAGAARQADLLEVVAAVEGKIGRGEVQALLRQAVAMALSAYRAAADAAAAEAAAAGQPGRALKSKCLSCDRDVEPWRPPPLGPLPSAAGLLPSVDKFRTLLRPSTAPQGPGLNAAELRRQQAGGAAAPPPPRSASPPPAKPGSGLQSGVVVTGGGERPPLARGDAARPGTAGGARPVFG